MIIAGDYRVRETYLVFLPKLAQAVVHVFPLRSNLKSSGVIKVEFNPFIPLTLPFP
jgi:hypothetical protein